MAVQWEANSVCGNLVKVGRQGDIMSLTIIDPMRSMSKPKKNSNAMRLIRYIKGIFSMPMTPGASYRKNIKLNNTNLEDNWLRSRIGGCRPLPKATTGGL